MNANRALLSHSCRTDSLVLIDVCERGKYSVELGNELLTR
jgi:hypothetical protein